MTRKSFPLLPLGLMLLLFIGCSGVKPATKTDLEVPDSWQSDALAAGFDPATGWLNDIDDPYLKLLATEAIESNHILKTAKTRVHTAGARSRIAGAPLLPDVEIAADASRRDSGSSIGNWSDPPATSWMRAWCSRPPRFPADQLTAVPAATASSSISWMVW